MDDKKLKIIKTSDLFTKDRKKGKPLQKILTTKDVPDELPVLVEQPVKSKPILTSDVTDGKDEKEE